MRETTRAATREHGPDLKGRAHAPLRGDGSLPVEDAPAEVGLIVTESLFVTTQETFTIILPDGTASAD